MESRYLAGWPWETLLTFVLPGFVQEEHKPSVMELLYGGSPGSERNASLSFPRATTPLSQESIVSLCALMDTKKKSASKPSTGVIETAKS